MKSFKKIHTFEERKKESSRIRENIQTDIQ